MRKVFLFAAIVFSTTLFSCGSATKEQNQHDGVVADTSKGVSAMSHDTLSGALVYICPCGGCPEIKESKAGKCTKCEMDLVQEKK